MTKMNDKELELIDSSWKQFVGSVERVSNLVRKRALRSLSDDFANVLATCPNATKLEHCGAFVGGLTWYSNRVLTNMMALKEAYGLNEQLTYDEMVTVALFHSVGKLGLHDSQNNLQDYYVPQTSEWHAQKLGAVFEINKAVGNLQVSALTMYWLNKYGVELSPREIQAILAVHNLKDMYASEVYNAEPLTMVLMQAVQATSVINRGFTNITCTDKWQG